MSAVCSMVRHSGAVEGHLTSQCFRAMVIGGLPPFTALVHGVGLHLRTLELHLCCTIHGIVIAPGEWICCVWCTDQLISYS